MTIEATDKLIAALHALKRDDVGAMSPVDRRRLVEALAEAHRIATIEATVADAKEAAAGLLTELADGRGRE